MAITWTKYKTGTHHTDKDIVRTWTTHEGLVVSEPWSREERVMSDIYASVTYCHVWNPEKGKAEVVDLRSDFDLRTVFGVSTVDAPQDILDIYNSKMEEDKRRAQEAKRVRSLERLRKMAEDAFNRPEKGKVMQVVRGRKVAKGTVGEVFWMDNPRNPSRVGLALSERRDSRGRLLDVAWVNAAYLVNTDPAGPDYEGHGVK